MKWIFVSGGVLLLAVLGLLLGAGPLRMLCRLLVWGAGFALLVSVLRYLVIGK